MNIPKQMFHITYFNNEVKLKHKYIGAFVCAFYMCILMISFTLYFDYTCDNHLVQASFIHQVQATHFKIGRITIILVVCTKLVAFAYLLCWYSYGFTPFTKEVGLCVPCLPILKPRLQMTSNTTFRMLRLLQNAPIIKRSVLPTASFCKHPLKMFLCWQSSSFLWLTLYLGPGIDCSLCFVRVESMHRHFLGPSANLLCCNFIYTRCHVTMLTASFERDGVSSVRGVQCGVLFLCRL